MLIRKNLVFNNSNEFDTFQHLHLKSIDSSSYLLFSFTLLYGLHRHSNGLFVKRFFSFLLKFKRNKLFTYILQDVLYSIALWQSCFLFSSLL